MNDKKLQRLAKKIAFLEKELKRGKNTEATQEEMEELVKGLSIEDLMLLDEYIQENHLIK